MLRFSKLQQTFLRQKTAPFSYMQQNLARKYFESMIYPASKAKALSVLIHF